MSTPLAYASMYDACAQENIVLFFGRTVWDTQKPTLLTIMQGADHCGRVSSYFIITTATP